jgi:hypothetical protein
MAIHADAALLAVQLGQRQRERFEQAAHEHAQWHAQL